MLLGFEAKRLVRIAYFFLVAMDTSEVAQKRLNHRAVPDIWPQWQWQDTEAGARVWVQKERLPTN